MGHMDLWVIWAIPKGAENQAELKDKYLSTKLLNSSHRQLWHLEHICV